VVGNDISSHSALSEIAGRGPAGANQQEWGVALNNYREAAGLENVDVDHANPEPRTPLDSTLVDKARRSDRYGDAIPWPLAVR
jgi:hypothetical protein